MANVIAQSSGNISDAACACAICGDWIYEADFGTSRLADLPRYDWEGYLDEILLAHAACVPVKDRSAWRGDWEDVGTLDDEAQYQSELTIRGF